MFIIYHLYIAFLIFYSKYLRKITFFENMIILTTFYRCLSCSRDQHHNGLDITNVWITLQGWHNLGSYSLPSTNCGKKEVYPSPFTKIQKIFFIYLFIYLDAVCLLKLLW